MELSKPTRHSLPDPPRLPPWSRILSRVRHAFQRVKSTCIIRWPGRLPVLIWTVGFCVLFGLTANDFVPLFQDYYHNNIAAKINLRTTPVPPNVTVCLPYYSTMFWAMLPELRAVDQGYLNGSRITYGKCPTCDAMSNNSLDFWRYVNVSDDDRIVQYLVQQFLEKRLDKRMLSDSNFQWLQPVIDVVWYYFKLIYEKDLTMLITENRDDEYTIFDYGLKFRNDVIDRLHNYLLESVVRSVAGGCNVKNDSRNDSGSMEAMVRMPSFTILGEKFCFPLPVEFGSEDIRCFYQHRLYGWHQYPGRTLEIYPTPAALYSTVTTKDAVYSTNQSAEQGWESVQLIYDIDSRLIANRSHEDACSTETHADICIAKLQAGAAVEECGCVPFRFRYLVQNGNDSGLPYCDGKIYIKCQDQLRKRLNMAQEACTRANKCEYTFYSWQPPRVGIRQGEQDRVDTPFTLTLAASKKPYIEFSSEEKFTSEQFLSQIGGLLNFYLGVSGLTLFALIIMLVEQAKKWYSLRVKKQSHSDGESMAPGWQHLRMLTIFSMLGSSHETKNEYAKGVQDLRRLVEDMRIQNERKLEEMRRMIWQLQADRASQKEEGKTLDE